MSSRPIAALFAALLSVAPAGALAQLTARAPLSIAPSAPGQSAKYTIVVESRISNETARPAQSEDVTFTFVDDKHIQLSTGQGADSETAIFDRGSDGRIHAKLKRGSLLYWPMQIFNRLQSVTSVALQTEPGEVRSGAIPLSESDDAVPGSLRVASAPNAGTDVAVDAAGPATPREMPRSANSGVPLGGQDQDKSSGPGLDAGSGQQSKQKAPSSQEGDATLHMRASYADGMLAHAESLEQIVVAGTPVITISRHWVLTKT